MSKVRVLPVPGMAPGSAQQASGAPSEGGDLGDSSNFSSRAEPGGVSSLQAGHRRPLAVLIPSRSDKHLEPLLTSMERSQAGSTTCVWVGDNGVSLDFKRKWPMVHWVPVPRPFVFAQAINILANASVPNERDDGTNAEIPDLMVLNDDTEVATVNWITMCQALLASERAQSYGMISVQIAGGVGNPEQKVRGLGPMDIVDAEKTICFVACLIPRRVFETIGGLDEAFLGYGFDDDDYCERVRNAGLKCGVTGAVTVKHGFGNNVHSSSYVPLLGHAEWMRAGEYNGRVFAKKYGKNIGVAIERRCLNLGCGDHPRRSNPLDSWLNIDIQALPGVDIVRDLKRGLPFDDASFDYVLADNILEHFISEDVVFLINEIDRVLKVGGLAEIIVPHGMMGQGAIQDPTHKSFFVPRSLLYWNQEMSARGGIFVGITANLLPHPTWDHGVQIISDPTQTEVFIRFFLQKRAISRDIETQLVR